MTKRTYSKRHSYSPNRKRSKSTGFDVWLASETPSLEQEGSKSCPEPIHASSSHKSTAVIQPKSAGSVFHKSLKLRATGPQPFSQPPSIYGSREDFDKAMSNRAKSKQGLDGPSTATESLPEGLQSDQTLETRPSANDPKVDAEESGAKEDSLIPHESPPTASITHTSLSPQVDIMSLLEDAIKPSDSQKAVMEERVAVHHPRMPKRDMLGRRLAKSPEKVKLWRVNQHNSPLLRLPEKLRSRIWEDVLSNHVVAIHYNTYGGWQEHDGTYANIVPIFKFGMQVLSRVGFDGLRHTKATQLHKICRQLFVETRLLPYELNLWMFASYNVMFNSMFFDKKFNREQLAAITQIMLPPHGEFHDGEMPGPNVLKSLRNLKWFGWTSAWSEEENTRYAGSNHWYRVIRPEGEDPYLQDERQYTWSWVILQG